MQILERIAPDIKEVIEERFQILQQIYWMQPVGRRTLASHIGITERVLRTETDFLKKLQLIDVSKSGMSLTAEGLEVYRSLEGMIAQVLGGGKKERQLADLLNIDHCLIVSGNSDSEPRVLDSFGDMVTETLDKILPAGDNVIAVMGGTTMAKVAEQMRPLEKSDRHNLFVPARGGIGESVSIQANSISALMAENSGGDFRALYVPEQVSPETYRPLLQEPSVQKVLALIEQSNCVIHSIGNAMRMAERRGMSQEELSMLRLNNAVAESFGYFFDDQGEVVYKIPRIGLQLKDLKRIPYIVAVAGGKSKAAAIRAYIKHAPKQTWLITDEGAANQILKEATL